MQKINFLSIWKLLIKNKTSLIIGQMITLFTIMVSIPIPLLLPILVDEVLLDKPSYIVNNINHFLGHGDAFYYILIVALCVILLRIIYFLSSALTTKIFTKIAKFVTFNIRKKLIVHLKHVNMNEYESLGSGAITSNLITDINTLDAFIITSSSKFISSSLTLLMVSFVVISIDPYLGCMILFIQPTIMFVSKKIAKNVGRLKKEENAATENFQDNLSESLDLFGQIKASNKENYFFNHSINKAKAIQNTSNEYNYKSIAYERFSFTLFLVFFEVLRASGLLLVAYSDLSIGLMFAMFGYIWFLMTPIQDLLSMQYSYANAKAALNRINKILDLKTEKQGSECLNSTDDVNIEIKNLSFSYTANKDILHNISFNINAKEKIALIGASGSGKTTLAQLISGFYEKSSGHIFYNKIRDDKLNKHSLRENIFLVLQMPILFNNTLRFNLTMGKEIENKKIFNALNIAQLKSDIEKMPQGLDTIVGKHGIRLSGGQRQRISIARMILANPKVIIFDESTSALDVKTENQLFDDLQEFLKDKTLITIAHRLSTVKSAQKIFVLNNGHLVQEGTHEELDSKNGHYKEFIKNQLI